MALLLYWVDHGLAAQPLKTSSFREQLSSLWWLQPIILAIFLVLWVQPDIVCSSCVSPWQKPGGEIDAHATCHKLCFSTICDANLLPTWVICEKLLLYFSSLQNIAERENVGIYDDFIWHRVERVKNGRQLLQPNSVLEINICTKFIKLQKVKFHQLRCYV